MGAQTNSSSGLHRKSVSLYGATCSDHCGTATPTYLCEGLDARFHILVLRPEGPKVRTPPVSHLLFLSFAWRSLFLWSRSFLGLIAVNLISTWTGVREKVWDTKARGFVLVFKLDEQRT